MLLRHVVVTCLLALPLLSGADAIADEAATNIHDETQLASPPLISSLTPVLQTRARWPTGADLARNTVTGAGPDKVKADCAVWMNRLLHQRWVPPDLVSRMIALRKGVLGRSNTGQQRRYDAVAVRYRVGEADLQVVQVSYAILVMFRPSQPDGVPPQTTAAQSAFAAAAMQSLFRDIDQLLPDGSLRGSERAAGIAWGVVASDLDWRHRYTWYTDGVTLIVGFPRLDDGSGIPNWPDWFSE